MRIVELDLQRIVCHVKTPVAGIAAWLWAREDDIPVSFISTVKGDSLSILIDYNDGNNGIPADSIASIPCYSHRGLIGGFVLPLKKFRQTALDLADAIDCKACLSNSAGDSSNGRIVAAFLREYVDDLFKPAQ